MKTQPDPSSDPSACCPAAPISVECRVTYSNGPAELRCWALEPTVGAQGAEWGSAWLCRGDTAAETVEWQAPPHATLESQCHAVLALHLYGSAAMPPRILGAPLWSSVTVSMCFADDISRAAQMNMQVTAPLRAEVSRRACGVLNWSRVHVALRPCDADPLRAMLNIGLGPDAYACHQPPSRPVRRAPDGGWVRGNLHHLIARPVSHATPWRPAPVGAH